MIKSVIRKAGSLARPTKQEIKEKKKVADLLRSLVEGEVSKYDEIESVEMGGSYSKGTWLASADVDIFVKFVRPVPVKKFEYIARRVGFAALRGFKPGVKYSEHPYVEGEMCGTKVNVVPCYTARRGEWKSAADRTPFHTAFMRENLTDAMRRDVRILKLFLSNNGIYGAEISRGGLSGYVTEVLVLHFGSFEGVVRAAAQMKEGEVVGAAAREFDAPIAIMDPIDPRRNLAAAVSNENLGRFVLLCRSFLKKPSMSYFITRERSAAYALLDNCIVVSFRYEKRSADMIWGQLGRAARAMARQLKLGGFKVIRTKTHMNGRDRASIFFLLESIEISPWIVRSGPEIFRERGSRRFIAESRTRSLSAWVGADLRIQSMERRPQSNARKFLEDLLGERLERSGVPGGIKEDVRRGFTVRIASRRRGGSIKAELLELISTDAAVFSTD